MKAGSVIRRASTIYFIQIGESGPVKIGVSFDPLDRLRQVQTASPEEVRLLACCLGTEQDEAALHEQFARHRIRGEWFRPVPALLARAKLTAGEGIRLGLAGEFPIYAKETSRRVSHWAHQDRAVKLPKLGDDPPGGEQIQAVRALLTNVATAFAAGDHVATTAAWRAASDAMQPPRPAPAPLARGSRR